MSLLFSNVARFDASVSAANLDLNFMFTSHSRYKSSFQGIIDIVFLKSFHSNGLSFTYGTVQVSDSPSALKLNVSSILRRLCMTENPSG